MTLKFSDTSLKALEKAFEESQSHKNPQVEPIHLLKTFLEDRKGYFFSILNDLQISYESLAIDEKLQKLPTLSNAAEEPKASSSLQALLQSAQKTAQELGDQYISSDHFFLAFCEIPPLNTLTSKEKALKKIKQHRGSKKLHSPQAENNLKALEKYCRDLTALARAGKLDPVIGRDEEIRRSIQVLSRRVKNNPMLIGEPGVGKTAIVEGLAHRIVQEDIPDILKNKQILALDMGSLIAGASYRGEFEERLKSVLEQVEKSEGQIILFIDEVHTLVGAGKTDGAMDAANLLKPALARGTLHCIGATTLSEYKKYIEKDAALERRFQTVLVEEPTLEDAMFILRGLKEKYEIFHGVRITEKAIQAAVQLSSRYISDRKLPDKAIDLMDEAASSIRIQIGSRPFAIDQLERHLNGLIVKQQVLLKESSASQELKKINKEIALQQEKLKKIHAKWNQEKEIIEQVQKKKNVLENLKFEEEKAQRSSDFTKVAQLRYGQIPEIEKELESLQKQLSSFPERLLKEEVDENLIAQIVSKWTKIPVDKMLQKESQKLLDLEKHLSEKVVGQNAAIASIADAVRRSRSGLSDPNRPIGVFLFLGPTGVGKTELVKTLANELFEKEDAIIRLDMSEYMEKHSVSKLIGSPPGYIGYEEGGNLSEQLKTRPYSVVLLDEIEKAHPEVLNILLQIFDDGRLTDNKGRVINCKNAIFIMTSNLGSELLLSATTTKDILKVVEPVIASHFKPEFINRIDEIIPFNPLSMQDMKKIVLLQLEKLQSRLQKKEIKISWSDQLLEEIAKQGYNPSFGARPLKRLIQNKIVNFLSKDILNGKIKEKTKLQLQEIKPDKLVYQVTRF